MLDKQSKKLAELVELVTNEMNKAEDSNAKTYYMNALDAVKNAVTVGMLPEVEDAKDIVSGLPSGNAKKALMKTLRDIPFREKINSLEELKTKGLSIIDEDETIVENRIMEKLQEKNLLVSDLAKLTGIARQNINVVVKHKMKPGIDFAIKVAYVLDVPVEELFTLTEDAWVKPYKPKRDSTLYVDVVNLMILDTTAKKEEIAKNGHEYFNPETQKYLTKEEYAELEAMYIEENLVEKVEELIEEGSDYTKKQLESHAKDDLRKEFDAKYVKMYKKLGEKIQPYVINSKKVVGKS